MNKENLEKAQELRDQIKIAEKDFDVITDPTDYRDNEKHIRILAKELAQVLCKD